MSPFEMPAVKRKVAKVNEYDHDWDETEEKVPRIIIDRTKFGTRDAFPNFILTDLQIHYYQTMYDQIMKNGTMVENVDTNALGMLALNLALVDECTFSIEEDGMSMEYKGDRKMVLKRNPALDVLKDAQAAVRFYLKEFKMTPGSRGKSLDMGGGKTGASDDGFDDI